MLGDDKKETKTYERAERTTKKSYNSMYTVAFTKTKSVIKHLLFDSVHRHIAQIQARFDSHRFFTIKRIYIRSIVAA